MVDLPPGFRVVPQGATPSKPIAMPEGFRVVQPEAATAQSVVDSPKSVMPNLTHIPILGPALGLAGYDGRAVPANASMVPALDPINAAGSKLAESIPIVGPKLAEFGNNVDAAFASAVEGKPVTAQDRAEINSQEQENFPVASGAGQAAGIVLPFNALAATKLGGTVLGQTGNLAQRTAAGLTSGGGIAFADTLARTGDMDKSLDAAKWGAAGGAAAPLVAKGASMAWNGIKSALQGASGGVDDVASQGLKSVASDMFQQSDAAGIKIDPTAYDRFVAGVSEAMKKGRVNPTLSPDAKAVLDELIAKGDELAASGNGITLGEMHDLRQIANAVAGSQKGRDQVLGPQIVDKLDEFLDGLTANDIGGGIDPSKAVDTLQTAIDTWHVAKKAQMIEEAIYKAQNAASGVENGLRGQFRAILNNANKRRSFSPDEIQMIEEVANGTVGANLLRLMGKFGFGGGTASNMLGGTIGTTIATTLGGPAAGFVAGGGASAARIGAEKMTGAAAQNALSTIAAKAPVNALGSPANPSIIRALAQMNNTPVKLPFALSPAVPGFALGASR